MDPALQMYCHGYSVDSLSLTLCSHCNEVVHGWSECERQITVVVLMGVPLPADLGLISATSCMIDK